MNTFIGIDNGVSGTIGIITSSTSIFIETPIIHQFNYTKKKSNISRIDFVSLCSLLKPFKSDQTFALLERPMVNPQRFQATTSALRSLEATIITLESLRIPFAYIDSKEWQKALLPKDIKGSEELKKSSLEIGCGLFPQHSGLIHKHKDADGLLIAEHCRLKYS